MIALRSGLAAVFPKAKRMISLACVVLLIHDMEKDIHRHLIRAKDVQ